MSWYRRRKIGPIGIDVGSRQIKMVQLADISGSSHHIASHAILPRVGGSAVLTSDEVCRMRDVFGRRGFRGSRVVIAAPPDKLACDMLELPPRSSGAPIDRIARAEIARGARLGQDNFEMALWDLPAPSRANGVTSVMAVALREADAASLLDPLEDDGLEVIALDAPGCALARACDAISGSAEEITAVLDVGWSAGTLFLLGNSASIYQRSLPEFGVGLLYREIMSNCGVGDEAAEFLLTSQENHLTPEQQRGSRWQWIAEQIHRYADSLAEEVKASFAYAAHRYAGLPVRSLRLAGGGAGVRGLGEHLGESLGVESRALTDSDLAIETGDIKEPRQFALLALAVGLARHEED